MCVFLRVIYRWSAVGLDPLCWSSQGAAYVKAHILSMCPFCWSETYHALPLDGSCMQQSTRAQCSYGCTRSRAHPHNSSLLRKHVSASISAGLPYDHCWGGCTKAVGGLYISGSTAAHLTPEPSTMYMIACQFVLASIPVVPVFSWTAVGLAEAKRGRQRACRHPGTQLMARRIWGTPPQPLKRKNPQPIRRDPPQRLRKSPSAST